MLDKFFGATRALYIARPDAEALSLVYRHPDTTIPRGAKLTVRSDEEAIFFRQGRLAGVLSAGAYVLDTANIPFLGGLVNVATGGNHYLAELFFVRTAETPLAIGPELLGSFVDLNSRNLLRLVYTVRVTVSVSDGVIVITQIGGQSSVSEQVTRRIVEARVSNSLKALVGERAQSLPIYEVISNALNEEFGAAMMARVAPELAKQGLRIQFLELSLALDAASEELLRRYQSREADLVIDARGAQVAADPGFATYNAVKGSRHVAEGLGDGLRKGMNGPMIGMGFGFNLGTGVPGAGVGGHGPSPSAGAAAAGARQASRRPDRFWVEGTGAPEGPYAARQVALWLIARGIAPAAIRVRVEGDPDEMWVPASADPTIVTEYSRRMPSAGPAAPVPQKPPTPAVPVAALYSYWNGEREEHGLPVADVASRVRTNGGGTNLVWAAGFTEWRPAADVPEIATLLAGMPPPPPRPPR